MAQVTKQWKLRRDGDGWIVSWPGKESRHETEASARHSIQRKINTTVGAWKRSGWTIGPQTQVTEGKAEVYSITGAPPKRSWVAVTFRLSANHKALIEEAAAVGEVSENEIINRALDSYFRTT